MERWTGWIPPFLVGASAATAGELTAGLLLYSGGGLLRGLTVVLATELLGLTLGLAASRRLDPGDLGALRRRWLLLLASFGAAAAFSAGWSVGGGFDAARTTQILGLGLLGAFPLFATGTVLGALARTEGEQPHAVSTLAALGAAAGVLATGLVGVPRLQPTSLFLLGVVAVSAAALVHGWIVDRRVVVRSVSGGRGTEPRRTESGVRLEERIHGASGTTARIMTVNGRAADGVTGDGEPLLPWAVGALHHLAARHGGEASRVLVVGPGTGVLLRRLRESSEADVAAVEPRPDVRELRTASGDRAGESSGGLSAETPADERTFDAVLVNLALLPAEDGALPGYGREELASLAARRSAGGALLLGGVSVADPGRARCSLGAIADEGWSPPYLALFGPVRRRGDAAGRLLRDDEWSRSGLVVGAESRGALPGEIRGLEPMGRWGPDGAEEGRGSRGSGPPR